MENSEYKILLVDDEPDILEFLGYNLTKEGYTIYKASNGKEALKLAPEVKPHLIILDVMMPEMDGIETCKEMKQIPLLNNQLLFFLLHVPKIIHRLQDSKLVPMIIFPNLSNHGYLSAG